MVEPSSRSAHSRLWPILLLLVGLVLSTPALAIQKSLAGVVDWHTKLIGIPRTDVPPTFHTLNTSIGVREIVAVMTERGVLAVLDGADGSVVWRTQFSSGETPLAYTVDADRVAVLTSRDSSTSINVFSAASGHLLTTHAFPADSAPYVPSSLGYDISFTKPEGSSDPTGILALHGAGLGHLTHLTYNPSSPNRTASLSPSWKWTAPDSGSTSTYIKAVQGGDRVHVLSMTSGFAGLSLGYTWIEVDGRIAGSITESVDGDKDVVELKAGGSIAIPSSLYGVEDVKSFTRDMDGSGITIVWEDKQRNALLSTTIKPTTSKPDIIEIPPYPSLATSNPPDISSKTFHSSDRSSSLTINPDGSLHYNTSTGLEWTREEGLSDIKVIKMVELPEGKVEDVKGLVGGESAGGRLIRHVGELKGLPSYIVSFILRFASGTYTKSLSSTPLSRTHLIRDSFGFQKLIVAATTRGKLFGLDSANGNVVWKTNLNGMMGVKVVEMFVVREITELGSPLLAVVAFDEETYETVAYHIDAFTGQALDVSDQPIPAEKPLGRVIASGAPLTTFVLPVEHCTTSKKAVAIVDQEKRVHLFPYCKVIEAAFHSMPAVHLAILEEATGTLKGYQVSSRPVDKLYPITELWTLPLGGPKIDVEVTDQNNGPVSSLGRILWDRSTLYSLLNPHLLVATVLDRGAGTAKILVVDSITGEVIYSKIAHGVDTSEGVEAILSNNWLVYKYSSRDAEAGSQLVHRIVTVELYESDGDEAQGESLEDSASRPAVDPVWRSFILPARISGLATSTSRFGVTFKDLMFITDRGQLAFMPNKLLDPRRPDVPNKKHQEEMLIPYQMFLPFDTRRTVSHANEVIGLRQVVTSPSLMESTSLVISHGLDMFASRVTPSGTFDILSDAFNKAQLILTIIGLGLGISVARPAIAKRMVRAHWY